MPRRGTLNPIDIGVKHHEVLQELAERESRSITQLGAVLVKWAMLQIRKRDLKVSDMAEELYEEENQGDEE